MSRGPEQLRLTPDERADLVAYIDGELPEGISRALATKLTQSATGRREVEMLKKTWELLGHLPVPEVSPQFSERTLTAIRRIEATSPTWNAGVKKWTTKAAHLLAYTLMAVVAFGMGYFCTFSIWPDPSAKAARDLGMLEHLDEYLEAGSFDFLTELADSLEFSPDAN